MAETSDRRVRGVVTCLVVGLWSCGHAGQHASGDEAAPALVRLATPAAPLPDAAPADADGANWIEPPASGDDDGRPRLRLTERLGDPVVRPRAGRLLGLLRGSRGTGIVAGGTADKPATGADEASAWPHPHALGDQLATLAALRGGLGRHEDVASWATTTLADLEAVLATDGPRDPAAADVFVRVAADAEAGLRLAPDVTDREVATDVRRASLALARRVAVWRAVGAACVEAGAAPPAPGFDGLAAALAPAGLETVTGRLLAAVEQFEASPAAAEAASVRAALRSLDGFTAAAPRAAGRAVTDHYLAPNVRVTVHERFVSRLLPDTTVETGPLHDFILGRQVTGTRTVEQSLGVRFVPDPEAIRLDILVNGEIASRTVTASGPVSFHSRGAATFTVRKPVVVSSAGFDLGAALGTASNRTQLANIQTSFDSVPIMGSLVRTIARNQHDDSRQAASREVNERIIVRACREVDRQAGPQCTDAAERVRLRVWEPLVRLGLEPTPVVLSTSEDVATARLRLAGPDQLGAHTPRPRPPADALLAVQLHDSAVNNACARLGLAGRRLTLEQFVAAVAARLGAEPRMPDDLPEHVTVSFPIAEPIRVACQDGLVHVWVTLDELESSRRTWCDIVAHVAYRPTIDGRQVFLEREGPVQLSGPGHQGRMEIALRTIFGKIFAKERRIPLVPASLVAHPRLGDVRVVQAVATDGWLAVALAPTTLAGGTAAPAQAAETPQRRLLRR